MSEPPTRAVLSFYWWGPLGGAVVVAICAWGAWRQYMTSGRFDPLYAIIAIWVVSYVAYRYVAYRRHSQRRRKATGTSSIYRQHPNPIDYFAGSLATTVIWIAILFVAVLALGIYRSLVA